MRERGGMCVCEREEESEGEREKKCVWNVGMSGRK